MNNSSDFFQNSLHHFFIKAKFNRLKPDFSNIQEIYLNNINIWYYIESDAVSKKDLTEVNSKVDTINNVILLNPENFIFSKSSNGFVLSEFDFINSELSELENLEINKLKTVEKKQLEYYVNFLNSKLISNKKLNTDNSIINVLSNQLQFILKTIKTDLNQNYQVYNYRVCEINLTFLDFNTLKNYITNKEIKNTASLLLICDYCRQIVDLWNKDLHNVPIKNFDEPFFCNQVEYTDSFLLSSTSDFYCIYLRENRIENFNTLLGKTEFIKKYPHTNYSLWEIAIKCTDIYNFLTIAFEEIHHKLEANATSNADIPQLTKTKKSYKEQILFKVGLLFATGEMNKYFTVNSNKETVMNINFTAPKIAKELKNDNYNKFILSTINNYTREKANGNKNIFNSFDMMTKIISHCEAENIPVDPYFKSRLPIH
jgi:hypothetical protein